MTWRFKLLALAALAHLILVASSAAHLRLATPRTAAARTIAAYGALSGSDNTFGFFAPHVAPEFHLQFTITSADGRVWEEPANRGVTREASLRFDSMTSLFAFDDLQPRIAASWAAALFGRYPDATRVEMLVEAEDMPTMESFRDGNRPEWDTIYTGDFSRRIESPDKMANSDR
jgi:hypothetical protein